MYSSFCFGTWGLGQCFFPPHHRMPWWGLSFTGTRQRPGIIFLMGQCNIIPTHLYIDTGIIFKHSYTFTCSLLWWLWTQQIGSSVSCRIINMHAVNMTVSQSLQYSSDSCPPVVRQNLKEKSSSEKAFQCLMVLCWNLCEPIISVHSK